MIINDNLELLNTCDEQIKKTIGSINAILDPMKDPDFKLLIIESKDQLKKCQEEVSSKIRKYDGDEKETSKVAQTLSKVLANTKLLMEKTDSHIAELLYDDCSDCLKSLYKTFNTYTQIDQNIKDVATVVLQSLIELRENLIIYL